MSPDSSVARAPVNRAFSRRDAGFTLLEVTVAVAIAAIALVALFQAGSAGMLTASEATRVEDAVDRAQSHLAQFADAGVIAPGESEGDDGDGYHWHLTARRIAARPAAATDQAADPPGLYDIKVTVSWGTGRHRRSVQLETERIGSAGLLQ
jgi:general secretion pathway protein I